MNRSELKDFVLKLRSKYKNKQVQSVQTVINPIVKKEIKELFPQFSNIHEQIYWLLNDLEDYPLCKTCGKKITRFDMSIKRYCDYCSKQCGLLNEETQSKFKKTMLERYGSDHPSKCEQFKEKTKQTWLKNFNSTHPSKVQIFKDKAKQTWLNKYGVCCSLLAPEIKEKIRKVNLQKYGTEFPIKNPIIKEKVRNTIRKEFGVDYIWQSKEIRKRIASKYYYRGIMFDSCHEIYYFLYLESIKEKFIYQPDISFRYGIDNDFHYYHPDFYLIDKDQYIEIKGDQFFDKNNKFINPYDKKHNKQKVIDEYYKCIKQHSIIIREKDFKKLGITFWNQPLVRKFCNFLKENDLSNYKGNLMLLKESNYQDYVNDALTTK